MNANKVIPDNFVGVRSVDGVWGAVIGRSSGLLKGIL